MERSQEYKEKSKASYDERAGSYDSSYYFHHAHKLYGLVFEAMDKFEYTSVLDVGCGTGNLLSEIVRRKKVTVAGIDLSEKMLAIAKKRLGGDADLRNGDSEHLPWKSRSFDMVTCTDSFHHYPDPKAVLKEMKRVLKPGGKVIIADPWAPSPFRQLANLLMPFTKNGDIRLYSGSEMEALIEESGLKVVSWQRIGISTFVLIAAAP